jgi:hypothetical protein
MDDYEVVESLDRQNGYFYEKPEGGTEAVEVEAERQGDISDPLVADEVLPQGGILESIARDAAAFVIGNTYGKAYVFRDDVSQLYSDLRTGNWLGAAESLGTLALNLPFPNYGFFGGANYGADQETRGPWHQPINRLDANNRSHDYNFRHWQWLRSNYSQLPPGPVGAAYVLSGTPLFLLGSGYQWLAD